MCRWCFRRLLDAERAARIRAGRAETDFGGVWAILRRRIIARCGRPVGARERVMAVRAGAPAGGRSRSAAVGGHDPRAVRGAHCGGASNVSQASGLRRAPARSGAAAVRLPFEAAAPHDR